MISISDQYHWRPYGGGGEGGVEGEVWSGEEYTSSTPPVKSISDILSCIFEKHRQLQTKGALSPLKDLHPECS